MSQVQVLSPLPSHTIMRPLKVILKIIENSTGLQISLMWFIICIPVFIFLPHITGNTFEGNKVGEIILYTAVRSFLTGLLSFCTVFLISASVVATQSAYGAFVKLYKEAEQEVKPSEPKPKKIKKPKPKKHTHPELRFRG